MICQLFSAAAFCIPIMHRQNNFGQTKQNIGFRNVLIGILTSKAH